LEKELGSVAETEASPKLTAEKPGSGFQAFEHLLGIGVVEDADIYPGLLEIGRRIDMHYADDAANARVLDRHEESCKAVPDLLIYLINSGHNIAPFIIHPREICAKDSLLIPENSAIEKNGYILPKASKKIPENSVEFSRECVAFSFIVLFQPSGRIR
jgi:hypothetical protein